jgi:predicted nucleic acid-binding Zn ribbon protein
MYIIFCFIVAATASNIGRLGFGYFLLSLILSPLIGFIIIVVLGENKNIRIRRILEDIEIQKNIAQIYKRDRYNNTVLTNNSNKLITYNDTKKCPFCAEFIKPEAIVCRFCVKDLPKEMEYKQDENIFCFVVSSFLIVTVELLLRMLPLPPTPKSLMSSYYDKPLILYTYFIFI